MFVLKNNLLYQPLLFPPGLELILSAVVRGLEWPGTLRSHGPCLPLRHQTPWTMSCVWFLVPGILISLYCPSPILLLKGLPNPPWGPGGDPAEK